MWPSVLMLMAKRCRSRLGGAAASLAALLQRSLAPHDGLQLLSQWAALHSCARRADCCTELLRAVPYMWDDLGIAIGTLARYHRGSGKPASEYFASCNLCHPADERGEPRRLVGRPRHGLRGDDTRRPVASRYRRSHGGGRCRLEGGDPCHGGLAHRRDDCASRYVALWAAPASILPTLTRGSLLRCFP